MKTKMNFLSLAISMVILSAVTLQAQTAPKEAKMKKHECSAACKQDKHMYAHGEEKHKCDKSCSMPATKELKDHTCTATCKKEGKCTMAHGEKGHSCDAACAKMK